MWIRIACAVGFALAAFAVNWVCIRDTREETVDDIMYERSQHEWIDQ